MSNDPQARSETHAVRAVQLVTARDLSAMLAVSESKVYGLAAEGTIPSIRVGERTVRFDLDDVMHALKQGAT